MADIDIWLAPANVSDETLDRERELLDDEERARAARFRFRADRARSIIARATLRRLLGRYLSRDPRDLRFTAGPAGKPELAGRELHFNVSHSHDRVAIAVTTHTPIGIDIEHEHPMRDLDHLATRFFAPSEAATVHGDPTRFFALWTAKESVIKALGDGLSLGLASFETHPIPNRFTHVTNLTTNPRLDGWSVLALPPTADGYHCAVCTRGDGWEVDLTAVG